VIRGQRDIRRRELGGQDPIDRRLGVPQASPIGWLLSLLRTRSALGLAPSLTPAVIFLPLGALLGPRVLGIIPTELLRGLDLAVTLALAVLGVLVGTALGREIRSAARLFVAASLESLMTVLAVAGASAYFIRATDMPVDVPVAALAIALGLSASASSATSADPDSEPAADVATRVADLDDVLPIVAAMAALPLLLPEGQQPRGLWIVATAPPLIGLAVGAIGWLLFERAESGAERAVFVFGALALAGGAAAYLGVSPLAVGLVAGLTWTVAPGRADRLVHEDLQKVQHPVVVLLLVTAGAMAVPSLAALWLLPPYLLFRLSGKVAGAWLSARLVDVSAADLAAYLMSPGVLAVALALNFRQMLPATTGDTLMSTVAIGTAAFELFALAVVPHWRRGARV
jgi:hypothetical protein